MSILDTPARNDLPGYFTRETKDLIMAAAGVGWKIHKASDGNSVTLHSYDGRKRMTFGTRRDTPLHRARRDIEKYADPEKLAIVRKGDPTPQETVQVVQEMEQAVVVHDVPAPAEPVAEHCAAWLEGLTHRQHRWYSDSDTEHLHPKMCEGMEKSSTGPTIVSERVMVAKAGDGEAYDSPTTIERIWSDGSKDYKCRFPGCEFTSDKRGAVPGHYARSNSHPAVGAPPEIYKADVPEARQYAPRQARVDSLADVIRQMLAEGQTDPEAMARQALTWVHEQSAKGTDLAAEREPLTAEETLARIRALLDTGERRQILAENERLLQEHLALQNEVDQAEERAREAEAETARIREEWQALADMIGAIREERQGA